MTQGWTVHQMSKKSITFFEISSQASQFCNHTSKQRRKRWGISTVCCGLASKLTSQCSCFLSPPRMNISYQSVSFRSRFLVMMFKLKTPALNIMQEKPHFHIDQNPFFSGKVFCLCWHGFCSFQQLTLKHY